MRRTRRERRSEGRCPWIQFGPIKSPHGGGRKPRPRPHLCRSCHGCVVENEAVELLMVNSYNQNHVLTLHQCCKCPFVKPLSYTLSLLGTRQSNYRAVLVIRHPQTTRADTEIDSHTHTLGTESETLWAPKVTQQTLNRTCTSNFPQSNNPSCLAKNNLLTVCSSDVPPHSRTESLHLSKPSCDA